MSKTYVLIADGASAKLYQRHTPHELEEIETWKNPYGHSADHDIASDKQGVNTGGGTHGGPLEPEVGPKRHAQLNFVKRVAGALEKRLAEFERLIVAAPPQILGDLRKALDSKVRARVDAEFGKDLTHIHFHDLAGHLEKLRQHA